MSLISLNLNPNLVVAAFINFHLLMVEVILYFKAGSIACVKGSIQNLQTELGFLMTFLGDTVMHLQHNKNIVTDIKAMVNETTKEEDGNKKKGIKMEVTKKEIMGIKALVQEVGSCLEPSFFLVTESGEWDLALSNLLTKFELLKAKIKEHCIAVSKMPSDMTPKTAMVSLFIVASVLDDLMDTINNKTDKIIGVEDQIVTLHKELMSLGSSVTNMAGQQEAEHELMLQMIDIAYEVEYVI
ncbi:Hypothetical predicted protein [Olea europaea subsp. europaea]|uniref:Uncharacterized protein n=1 Tax=Olea europaea subsp. europaea TaxID=158383 RepID=A0A8S0U1M1_OLEEU|nr:Hypothetical predicted protein [Olea europaea subsp. europaea]